MTSIFNFILHIDEHLGTLIQNYGSETYLILFLIIFVETGLIIMPFLPGDSLLFAAGALAARGFLRPGWLFVLLALAAIVGDAVNYWTGRKIGQKIFEKDRPLISEEYLMRTKIFYEKHGKKTIVLARFLPVIRTFAPFVAGVSKMNYREFAFYNIIGGVVWVGLFVFGGYFFGNVPAVKDNFALVIAGIIAVSAVPPIIEFWKHRKNRKKMVKS